MTVTTTVPETMFVSHTERQYLDAWKCFLPGYDGVECVVLVGLRPIPELLVVMWVFWTGQELTSLLANSLLLLRCLMLPVRVTKIHCSTAHTPPHGHKTARIQYTFDVNAVTALNYSRRHLDEKMR